MIFDNCRSIIASQGKVYRNLLKRSNSVSEAFRQMASTMNYDRVFYNTYAAKSSEITERRNTELKVGMNFSRVRHEPQS